ncbi:hypothetical protein J655_2213 [Acinetobacter sp. 1294243]|nr:hypothetical protein J655_2213 [Acinetobacter sp. 1294243]
MLDILIKLAYLSFFKKYPLIFSLSVFLDLSFISLNVM